MKTFFKIWFLAVSSLIISACVFTADDPEDAFSKPDTVYIDPTNANDIQGVLVIPSSTVVAGATPAAGSGSSLTNNLDRSTITNGGTINFDIDFTGSSAYTELIVQVIGADSYLSIPGDGSISSGNLQIPVSIPPEVEFTLEEEFCVQISIGNAEGNYSNIVETCLDTLNVGTGAMQVSLSWDNTSDMDLYVAEPSENIIYYGNPLPLTAEAGKLDVDDADGFGPENIFWTTPASGIYTVSVEHFSGESPTDVTVSINTLGTSKTFNKSIASGEQPTIATITISEGSATIQ